MENFIMLSCTIMAVSSSDPLLLCFAALGTYVLAGIVAYGAYRNLELYGKMVYAMLFPVHWSLFAFVAAAVRDHRFVTVPLVLLVGGFMLCLGGQGERDSWLCPVLIFLPLLLSTLGSSGRWNETE